jgi:DNA-3-methyladenine glycosylase
MSMTDRLNRRFYLQSTESVAEALIGCRLVRITAEGTRLSGIITETEAYLGAFDSACHTSAGMTSRNSVMFGPGGFAYVYFVYGLHHMLNVVTEEEGKGCAVLIRSVEADTGTEIMFKNRGGMLPLAYGPARLTQAFEITRKHNGLDLVIGKELYIKRGIHVNKKNILRKPRVGIDYAAAKDKEAPLRFILNPGSAG